MDARQARLEVGDEAVRGAGWRVPTVEQAVDHDVGHARLPGELRDGHRVAVHAVDPAGSDEPHQVQTRAALGDRADRGQQCGILAEGASGDLGVDAGQVLEHRPAGSDVEVSDLAVAHLPVGQPDRGPGSLQPAVRPVAEQRPPARHVRSGDGVHGWVRTDAEAVDDDEDDGARSCGTRGHSWDLPSSRSPAGAGGHPGERPGERSGGRQVARRRRERRR